MPTRNLLFALLLACAGLLTTQNASAGLMGKTLQVAYYGPTSIISASASQFTVSNSVEVASWPVNFSYPALDSIRLAIDATDTSITFSNLQELLKSWSNNLYIVITDINNALPDFSSDPTKTFLSSTIPGLTNSDISITADGNSIRLFMNGVSLPKISDNGFFTLQVGFANTTPTPVPAPAPILLMISGLLLHRGIKFRRCTRN